MKNAIGMEAIAGRPARILKTINYNAEGQKLEITYLATGPKVKHLCQNLFCPLSHIAQITKDYSLMEIKEVWDSENKKLEYRITHTYTYPNNRQ